MYGPPYNEQQLLFTTSWLRAIFTAQEQSPIEHILLALIEMVWEVKIPRNISSSTSDDNMPRPALLQKGYCAAPGINLHRYPTGLI